MSYNHPLPEPIVPMPKPVQFSERGKFGCKECAKQGAYIEMKTYLNLPGHTWWFCPKCQRVVEHNE